MSASDKLTTTTAYTDRLFGLSIQRDAAHNSVLSDGYRPKSQH